MVDQYRANVRFVDVLQHFLNRGLQSWVTEDLTQESMEGMYEYILQTVNELFSQCKQNLTTDTRTWVAQQLYLSIKIKKQGDLELPDGSNLVPVRPVFQPVDIARIPNDELRLIGGLLSDCEFAVDIAKEIRKRTYQP